MLNGTIFINEGILSLDLRVTLSKYYKIENDYKSIGQPHMDSDFCIIDPEIYTSDELKNLVQNLNPNVNIIALTSQPEEVCRKSFQCSHVITKPYDKASLLLAIEN